MALPTCRITLTGDIAGNVLVRVTGHMYEVASDGPVTVDGRTYGHLRAAVPITCTATAPGNTVASAALATGDDPARLLDDEDRVRRVLPFELSEHLADPGMRDMVLRVRRWEFHTRQDCRCGPGYWDCPETVTDMPLAWWPAAIVLYGHAGLTYCETARMLACMPEGLRELFCQLVVDGMDYEQAHQSALLLT